MDGFEDMLLTDLGIGEDELPPQEGAVMDYLPVKPREQRLMRPEHTDPAPYYSYSPGRVSHAEKQILTQARANALIQDAATELVGRGIEKSMSEARRAVTEYFQATEIMFAVADAAQTDKHRIVMERFVDRIVHDRGQALAHNLRMGDRMRAELTEHAVKQMKRAAKERSFWDSMFGR